MVSGATIGEFGTNGHNRASIEHFQHIGADSAPTTRRRG